MDAREKYRTDPEFRAAKLASNKAYNKAHPEKIRAAVARYRARHPLPGPHTPEDRFWAKVEKSDHCWIWIGARDSYGYGNVRIRGEYLKAPRAVWRMIHGAIPDGLFVCHRCDNPPCVRPDHLFLGTSLDNTRDRMAKGRPGGSSECPVLPDRGVGDHGRRPSLHGNRS